MMSWISVQGDEGGMPVVRGPSAEFLAVTRDVIGAASSVRGVVLEWSNVHGPLALWERAGDEHRLLWESGAADELRRREANETMAVDFVGRSTADERRRAVRRQRAASSVCDD